MNIKGQEFTIEEKHIAFELHDPYWGAYKLFGWPTGTEGYSISEKALDVAFALEKDILIKTRYGNYAVSAKKAFSQGGQTAARNGTKLICIPRFALTRYGNPPTIDTLKQQEVQRKIRL